jgi:hypothetical protein
MTCLSSAPRDMLASRHARPNVGCVDITDDVVEAARSTLVIGAN